MKFKLLIQEKSSQTALIGLAQNTLPSEIRVEYSNMKLLIKTLFSDTCDHVHQTLIIIFRFSLHARVFGCHEGCVHQISSPSFHYVSSNHSYIKAFCYPALLIGQLTVAMILSSRTCYWITIFCWSWRYSLSYADP